MPRRSAAKAAATPPARFELGGYWLWYRANRDDWAICWLDGRTTRRVQTGIGGGSSGHPPEAAKERLAEFVLEQKAKRSALVSSAPVPPTEILLQEVVAQWLERHVSELSDGRRYADSVLNWERFWDQLKRQNQLPDPLVVSAINSRIVDAFIGFRRAEGATPPTISRDLAALRGPINWALKEEIITSAPRVKDVKGKDARKELEWSPEQVAVILEAAWANEARRHVHLFTLIHCSTHGRTEAIVELDADTQFKDGLIYFNRPGRVQTRKRRSIVPICPTLAPWLEDVKGKVIRYRVPTSEDTRAAGGPEFYERPTNEIRNAFRGVLLDAHARRPDLGFAKQAVDEAGKKVWLPPREKLGDQERRPKLQAIGSPNTLRHTIHTWHQRQGVPQAQIDAAAGHSSEQGSGANYTHMRPEYLREFIASTEAFWRSVDEYTRVHRRHTPEGRQSSSS